MEETSHHPTSSSLNNASLLNPTTQTDVLYDVVIIGGGLAGLTAANDIVIASTKPNIKVIILEASPTRLGGRVSSIDIGAGRVLDQGGMWIGDKHVEMLDLIKRFGLEKIDQYVQGKHVYFTSNGVRKEYSGKIPPISLFALVELKWRVLYHIDTLVNSVNLDEPWTHPRAREFDGESVESYFRKRLWFKSELVPLINDLVKSWAGAEANAVSFLFFLVIVKSAGGLDFAIDGAQQWRVLGGAHSIIDRLQEMFLKSGRIEMGCEVTLLERVDRHLVRCVTKDQRVFKGKIVIVAANSCNFIKSCEFIPRLPLAVEQYARRAYNAAYGKAIVIYKHSWWRDAGFSGMYTSSNGFVISSSYDYCTPSSLCALVFFFAGEQANAAAMLTEEERKTRCIMDLKIMFGPTHQKDVDSFIEYHEKLWNLDPIARGCSSIMFPPGSYVDYCPSKIFAQGRVNFGPAESLYFVGTELSKEYVGYMEGAVQSGKDVAERVLDELGGQEESVQV